MERRDKNGLIRRLAAIAGNIWVKRALLLMTDGAAVALAYLFTLLFRFGGNVPELFMHAYAVNILAVIAIHFGVNAAFRLYSSLWAHAGVDELVSVVAACTLSAVLSYVFAIIIADRMPRSIYIGAGLVLMLAFGGVRLSYRVARHFMRSAKRLSVKEGRALIIGAGETGSAVARQISDSAELDITVCGFVDDARSMQGARIYGLSVLGRTADIPRLVRKHNISQLIFAVPSASAAERRRILNICTETGCRLRIIPGLEAMLDGIDIKRIRDVNITDLLSREEVRLDTEAVSGYLTGASVLVTGGGGSIGSELCRQIIKFGPKRLSIFDIYENNAYELLVDLRREYGESVPVDVFIGSVRDMERVRAVMAEVRPDVVFHAAAHKHVPLMETSPEEAVKNNVAGTLNAAKAADEFGVKRFVQISTDKAVNPTNIMGATKYMCELIMQYMNETAKTTRYVAVRFGNVLGSNGSVIPLFKRQIEAGGPVTVTDKNVTRYFMTIPEAAQLVIQAGSMAGESEIFLLDMGEPVRIDDFARTFIRLSGFEPDVDMKISYIGLRPGEKMYEELLQRSEHLGESSFPGILVGKTHPLGAEEIMARVDRLIERSAADPAHVHEYIAEAVPTYHREDRPQ